ncbi:MAG: ribonuclease H-like domain-containing protein [Candidatus Zixiibacteriota bacterium]
MDRQSLDQNTIRARVERMSAHIASGPPAVEPIHIGPESVGAIEVRAPRGRFWHRRVDHAPEEPWGEHIPESLLSETDPAADAESASVRVPFDDPGARVDLRDCVFLDCETTGLSGGAGTIPFLIALGQFDGTTFAVDQFFLADPSDEAAVLDCVAARLAEAKALVTYNGRAFDAPLLEGRFHFWRLSPEFVCLPHLDLLWPTRALFAHRLESCALSQVEEQLLRYARTEDLPGSEVPGVYFEYLRAGFSPRLHAVFEHNRFDVVSLFVYALWLNAQTHPTRPRLAAPDDLMALARLWFRRHRSGPALAALGEAESRVLDGHQRARLHELRGRILKRDHEYEAAHSQWQSLAAIHPARHDAAEEMAKHLEHRRRDFAAALAIVDRALENLRIRESLGEPEIAGARESLLRRQMRLKRRLAVAAPREA